MLADNRAPLRQKNIIPDPGSRVRSEKRSLDPGLRRGDGEREGFYEPLYTKQSRPIHYEPAHEGFAAANLPNAERVDFVKESRIHMAAAELLVLVHQTVRTRLFPQSR